MTPTMFARLEKAVDAVHKAIAEKASAAAIIDILVKEHAASVSPYTGQTYSMRVAGVQGSCTWSRDQGMLDAWRKNATLRILRERGISS